MYHLLVRILEIGLWRESLAHNSCLTDNTYLGIPTHGCYFISMLIVAL